MDPSFTYEERPKKKTLKTESSYKEERKSVSDFKNRLFLYKNGW